MRQLSDKPLISHFEELVDELEKPTPNEDKVKELMEKLDLKYTREVTDRISLVLDKMNKLIFESRQRKDSDDIPEYS